MERPMEPRPVLSRAGAPDRGPVAATVVVVFLVGVALLKPWPSVSTDAQPPTDARPAIASSALASPADPASAEARIALPTTALDPPASDCYVDSGWRICMFGNTEGREIRAWFGENSGQSTAAIAPTTPAVLLISDRGAGLGLYAPRSAIERLPGQSVVSAWLVREGTGITSWIALRHVASVGRYDVPAGAVYRPPPDGLGSADRWPNGGYIVRLQAATGGWERWFAMEITSVPGDGTRPPPDAGPRFSDRPKDGAPSKMHTLRGPA
jgi:hypothetical protein